MKIVRSDESSSSSGGVTYSLGVRVRVRDYLYTHFPPRFPPLHTPAECLNAPRDVCEQSADRPKEISIMRSGLTRGRLLVLSVLCTLAQPLDAHPQALDAVAKKTAEERKG